MCAVSRHPLRIAENMGTAKDRQAQASSLITANPSEPSSRAPVLASFARGGR